MDSRIPPPFGEVPSMYKKCHIWEPGVPEITEDFVDKIVTPVLRERVFSILDHRLPYGKQKPEIIETCKQHALAYFPIFEKCYVDAWPISVLTRSYLYDFRRKLGQRGNRKRGDPTILQTAMKRLRSPLNIPNVMTLSSHEVVEFYTSLVNRRHTNLGSVSADDFKLLLGALLNTCQRLGAAHQDVPDDVNEAPSASVTTLISSRCIDGRFQPYPCGAIGMGLGAEQVVGIMAEADTNM
ncbi:hypothetical protein NLI96_g10188 [Meripilus lineatus]|uniref:Uncharacterized protein n=1 Tax=Meripilus lineatus TaxID=2056292 RepID=A0AAD5UVU5_9APHY|nr:hypothetical protein NLI96_g10188 [Physisporinus lineatus]